jgi:hypothetical protein
MPGEFLEVEATEIHHATGDVAGGDDFGAIVFQGLRGDGADVAEALDGDGRTF